MDKEVYKDSLVPGEVDLFSVPIFEKKPYPDPTPNFLS